jgi:hypothetical protein
MILTVPLVVHQCFLALLRFLVLLKAGTAPPLVMISPAWTLVRTQSPNF